METMLIEHRDDKIFLRFANEITLDYAASMKKEVEQAVSSVEYNMLVADLSKVVFIDSSGIGFLVALKTKAASLGKEMFVLGPSEEIRKTFELVQLLSFFQVVDNEDELL